MKTDTFTIPEVIDYQYRDIGKDLLIDKRYSHGNSYEIVQVLSGDGVFMIDKHIFPLREGCVYLVNGMDIHCSNPEHPADYIRNKIVLSAPFINGIARAAGFDPLVKELFNRPGRNLIRPGEAGFAAIDLQMKQIASAVEESETLFRLKLASALLGIFSELSSYEEQSLPPLEGKLSGILQYIDSHLQEKILLDEICAYTNLNKYYLCHLFKETTSMTLSDYILQKRLSLAKQKLLYTDQSISEIALSCGFGSFSYFSALFKKNETISPGAFRRCNGGNKI